MRKQSMFIHIISRLRKNGYGWTGLMCLLGLLLVLPLNVFGFQFYFFFECPASEGCAGGDYFTGSPRYKLYNCTICHVGSPGKIRVSLRTEPENIFQVGYQPGRTYTVQLSLEEELNSPENKIFSTNNFCLEVLDSRENTAGSFDLGFPWNIVTQLFDPLVLSPDGTTVLSGFFNMDLDWQWFWTAPAAGTGNVVFYLGFVDGNGDIKAFSDDVAVLKKEAFERP